MKRLLSLLLTCTSALAGSILSYPHVAAITTNGATFWFDTSLSVSNAALYAIDFANYYITNGWVVPATNAVTTSGSLTGGGTLGTSRTISLVNDSTSPGNSYYYGTSSGGTKGFYALPSGVSSVGLSLPTQFSVTGSPVTSSGTLSATWASETQNYVFAAPSGASGTPTFRALVSGDIPALSYVTSVALSLPGIFTVSGSPITSSGTLSASLASQTSNTFWAAPNGSSGAPAFRTIVGADLPNPSASTLGGVQSYTSVSHQWINSISTAGVPTGSQPAFTDISGSLAGSQLPALGGDVSNSGATITLGTSGITAGSYGDASHTVSLTFDAKGRATAASTNSIAIGASQVTSGTFSATLLPTPTASTLGGVESITSASHQWVSYIDTSGVPHQSQPAFTDISGSVSAGQLPSPSATSLGGVESYASVAHQWINTISTAGVPASSQPAFTDISGSVAATQMPALTGDVTTSAGTVATTIGTGVVTATKSAYAVKPPANAVSVANIASLSGTTTVDGVSLVAGNIVLLTAQSTGSQNGPWVIAAGAWTRPGWYTSGNTAQAFQYMIIPVLSGTTYGGSLYDCTTSGAITIDTTSTTWAIVPLQQYLPLAGGTMAGNIAMGSSKVTGLGTPSASGDAVTLGYFNGNTSLYQDVLFYQNAGSSVKAMSAPTYACNTSSTLNSNTLYLSAIFLPVSQTLTGVGFIPNTLINFTSSGFTGIGVYSVSNGTNLTLVSSITNTAIFSSGSQVYSKYAIPGIGTQASGLYYIGFLYNASSVTTKPTVAATSYYLLTADKLDSNSGFCAGIVLTGQSSLPSTINTSGYSGSQQTQTPFWAALY